MTIDCRRCGSAGGVDEMLSGIGYLLGRLTPLSFWLGVTRPMLHHAGEGKVLLAVIAFGVAFLLVVRLLFPGRITRTWFQVRGCPKCGGRCWSCPHYSRGFGL